MRLIGGIIIGAVVVIAYIVWLFVRSGPMIK